MMDRAERRRRTHVKVASRLRVLKWSGMLDLPRIQVGNCQPGTSEHLTTWEGMKDHLIGRCKNMHPFDCGRPRCGVCSGHKRLRSSDTFQEVSAIVSQNEWLHEIGSDRPDVGQFGIL